jgi:hypothetical protein
MMPMLGGLLDRKLSEQYNAAARVAETAALRPDHLCLLLEDVSGESADGRQTLARLAGCGSRETTSVRQSGGG